MIPKKIHYCWFGRSEKPALAKKCIMSWYKFCPDYEIIEWNEDNFDISQYPYAEYCYKNKKYAFLSDFVRLAVISEYGGIYFDTDVELLKRPDELLRYEAFYGFENAENVATGLGFGSVSHHVIVDEMKKMYLDLESNEKAEYSLITCPKLNTEVLVLRGLRLNGGRQNVSGAEIFPAEYFNPYDDPTGRLNKTRNTISIHWYCKSWLSKKMIIRSKMTKPIHRIFGVDCFKWLKK